MAKIEKFIEQHPEAALWQPDPANPTARVHELGDGVRLAGTAEHILIEIDGEVWPVKAVDFPPAP